MMMIDDCPVHFVHHHLLRVCKHICTHKGGSSVCPDEDDDDDDNEADETYNDDDTDSDDSDDGGGVFTVEGQSSGPIGQPQ